MSTFTKRITNVKALVAAVVINLTLMGGVFNLFATSNNHVNVVVATSMSNADIIVETKLA